MPGAYRVPSERAASGGWCPHCHHRHVNWHPTEWKKGVPGRSQGEARENKTCEMGGTQLIVAEVRPRCPSQSLKSLGFDPQAVGGRGILDNF